ncbi:biotin-dependent carboxyltransferase family protein [uncultured Cocleimonas sp.]|uniref:5-oxoprolinase subunit C family protein n=1 Tax=uncultured Cocleimonas sp. TaxID=1051587 RepID=UPI002624088B|nr:biotin-dependent carboxyltransferase family protein [uncultured Cocleimonas sp.]
MSLDDLLPPTLQIVKPGVISLLQDYGRYGMQHYGITNSGPMDEHAYLWANRLLQNNFNAPQIEICLGGFEARFSKPTRIAICGAHLHPTLNHKPLKTWHSYAIKAGDVLRFGGAHHGLYTYLAIAGGFDVKPQLSSCSTVMREHLGGIHQNGEKLVAGDSLDYPHYNERHIKGTGPFSTVVPEAYIPSYPDKISIRFIPNYSENGCGEATLNKFTEQSYRVSNEINRMGYRLKGEALPHDGKSIISQGISTGFIQLPKDGQPIVLMKDRQTIGGYPLLGCVAHLDVAKLSQSKPGVEVEFVKVGIQQLESELVEHLEFFGVAF